MQKKIILIKILYCILQILYYGNNKHVKFNIWKFMIKIIYFKIYKIATKVNKYLFQK